MNTSKEDLKRRLLVKYPSFGSVIANLDFVETTEYETAATDGESLFYNPDFLLTLSEEEETFLLAHEVCHVAFNHIFRSEGRDPELWNLATDAVINALLVDEELKMIEGGVNIPEAIHYNAEEMYEKLLKEKQEKMQAGKGNTKEPQTQNDGQGNQQGQLPTQNDVQGSQKRQSPTQNDGQVKQQGQSPAGQNGKEKPKGARARKSRCGA